MTKIKKLLKLKTFAHTFIFCVIITAKCSNGAKLGRIQSVHPSIQSNPVQLIDFEQ